MNQNKKTTLLTSHMLRHFKTKSPSPNSCFQPHFKTSPVKSPKKNRITLEKMTLPNSQEKNTPDFLEEYAT
jgi:hypothetical protein